MKKLIAVAVSGGVDSSTAAFLLKKAGHEVIGLHMRLWYDGGHKANTHGAQNKQARAIDKAEQACHAIDIPFHIIDLEEAFKGRVVDYFCRAYMQGRTPNPCVICNKYIKFGLLLEKAIALGADFLATGHYAGVDYLDATYHLRKGVDSGKDQSYMLYTLEQKKLSRILFPLGGFFKGEVRRVAQENNLPTATEPGSQDICFIDGNYGDFFKRNIMTQVAGAITNSEGKVLGQHCGIPFYTIGQRHGLGLAAEQRLYVTRIEPETNKIVVGCEEELYSQKLIAKEINWILGKPPVKSIEVNVKIRYKSPEVAATLYPESNSAEIEFHQPQRAVTPGQAVVFYHNGEVIGGGTIEKTEK